MRAEPLQPPRTRAQLTPEQAELHDRIVSGPRASSTSTTPLVDEQGRLLGPFGIMLVSPQVGDAVQELGSAIRYRSALSDRMRELAILVVAAECGSVFEWRTHEAAARAAGISTQQLASLHAGGVPEDLPPDEGLLVSAIRDLLREGRVPRPLAEQAVAALGQERFAELVWLAGYYRMLATALHTYGIDAL